MPWGQMAWPVPWARAARPSPCESPKPLTKRERVQRRLLDLRATGQGLPGGPRSPGAERVGPGPPRPPGRLRREGCHREGGPGAPPRPAPRSIYC